MLALVFLANVGLSSEIEFKGGLLPMQTTDCITSIERQSAEKAVWDHFEKYGEITPQDRQQYQVVPIGGIMGEDVFPNNYVDMDSSSGIRDWDCSDYTYDGHRGIDIDLKSFYEQDAGVPVFAPLAGVVVETDDGNFDRNVFGDVQPGNHVIVYHGGTHYSLYWHFKRGSISVNSGDKVTAGQQLGMVGSSGSSTGPHLHFESWSSFGSQFAFDPHTGNCNQGQSGWINQVAVPRQFYIRDMNFSMCDLGKFPGLPWELPRAGTYLTGTQSVGFMIQAQNLPANSTWRVRFLRPNNSVAYDSGTGTFGNNAFYRGSWWYWRYNMANNVTGTWKVELTINGTVAMTSPYRVVSSYPLNGNQPPNKVTLATIPPSVKAGPISVRISAPTVLDDPDYDVVRYRFLWKLGSRTVRDVTHAGHLDMIPGSTVMPAPGYTVSVTPNDGLVDGPTTTIRTREIADY